MRAARSGLRGVFWRAQEAGSQRHPVTKARGDWWIRWVCEGFGHLHKQKVGPKSLAAMQVQERRLARPCPTHTARPTRVLLADAVAAYLREQRHKRSRKEDARHGAFWTEHLGSRAVDEITKADLRRIRTERLRTVGPATVNRQLAFLRQLFYVLIEDGTVTTANPVRQSRRGGLFLQEPSGRVRYLTDDEEPRLFAQLAPWEQARVTVLLDTGLRKAEFLGLRQRDVDFKGNVLTIPRSKHGERRHVPMTSRVRAILGGLPRALDGAALVFPNSVGDLDDRWVAKRFPRAVDAAEITDFRFHDLRHTFASRLVMAGVDLKTVQELGGWKSLSMVARYAHLSPGHLQASIERLVENGVSALAPGLAPRNGAVGPRAVTT